ncbi:MAG: phosphoribosylformylglycinamidine synthase subunit PurL [Magnetovibrio sp.]|nr:phosphoribosylformylglycinamidine synthase subunit PurL [Magnetovibrio sp.]
MNMSKITPAMVKEHGLNEAEYQMVLDIMGREPNINELGIFSVMWSEHCSYKSSKKWLKTLPTKAPWVICGPGENAGIIDAGDGHAIIFKMESHNHPSYIEPYQGAATGVGGIMRDVFTMGARPIANLNALRFGLPDHPKTRHLVHGVVEGVGSYGNCMGVPTVGGEVEFDSCYDGNILVNAMCVGLADADNIFYCAAAGIGNPVVYVGSKTGRDGIHGATMASAEFTEDSEEKRPTVQVGDPFTEKLLLEACLELMQTDAIVAIQDMGAAGLTSSSFEMASSGGVGIDMNLDKVPQREENMTPYEMMLSESQERMLMVLKPGKESMAQAIFEKWELDFAVIGTITDTGRMRLFHKGDLVGDLPISPLADASPEYDRPWVPTPKRAPLKAEDVPAPDNMMEALKTLVSTPNGCSKRWVWEQYDHMVMGDTVARPGGDAAIVRIHGTDKGVAMTSDVTPRYVFADPVEGGKQAVAETYRNITATGATPKAITDNMNFGNPERPEIMGQFVGACEGIAAACIALDYPVVSGNVSLYNETNGQGILPTPTIGGVGFIDDVSKSVGMAFVAEGESIILIGDTSGHLGSSQYLAEVLNRKDGPAPTVDLSLERKHGDFVRGEILAGTVTACHDLSDGGLGVGLAEMAMASGLGANIIDASTDVVMHGWLFGEDQARYLVTTANADGVLKAARAGGVSAAKIGEVSGRDLNIENVGTISVTKLKDAHEGWMPDFMAHPDFEV